MFDLSKPLVEISIDGKKKFDVIPEGEYPVRITKCEWKVSKTGNEYLEMMLQLFNCVYANRMIFHRVNLLHESEKVRNYALSDVKRMLGAGGIDTKNLSVVDKRGLEALLYQVQAMARLSIEQGSSGYPDKNIVKGWRPISVDGPVPEVKYNNPNITFDTNDIPF